MAKHTKENIKLTYKGATKTTSPCWYYQWGPKPNNKKRFGTAKSGNDVTSDEYKRALDRCIRWLDAKAMGGKLSQFIDAIPEFSDYRFDKIIRGNIKACESATPTTLAAACLAMDEGRWGSESGIMHTELVVGKKACYKIDISGLMGLDFDTTESVLLTQASRFEILRMQIDNTGGKYQTVHLEELSKLYGVAMPKYVKGYPDAWDDLLKLVLEESADHGDKLDEWLEAGLIDYES